MPRRPLHSIPTFVLLLALLALVGAGAQVAVRMPGGPSAWGANTYGKLGDGTKDQRNSPVALGSLADVTAVSAGEVHSVVLRRDGSV